MLEGEWGQNASKKRWSTEPIRAGRDLRDQQSGTQLPRTNQWPHTPHPAAEWAHPAYQDVLGPGRAPEGDQQPARLRRDLGGAREWSRINTANDDDVLGAAMAFPEALSASGPVSALLASIHVELVFDKGQEHQDIPEASWWNGSGVGGGRGGGAFVCIGTLNNGGQVSRLIGGKGGSAKGGSSKDGAIGGKHGSGRYVLSHVDGVSTAGMPISAVKHLVQGPEGTHTELTVTRPGGGGGGGRGGGAVQVSVIRTVEAYHDVQLAVYRDVQELTRVVCMGDVGERLETMERHACNNPPVVHRAYANLLSLLLLWESALLSRRGMTKDKRPSDSKGRGGSGGWGGGGRGAEGRGGVGGSLRDAFSQTAISALHQQSIEDFTPNLPETLFSSVSLSDLPQALPSAHEPRGRGGLGGVAGRRGGGGRGEGMGGVGGRRESVEARAHDPSSWDNGWMGGEGGRGEGFVVVTLEVEEDADIVAGSLARSSIFRTKLSEDVAAKNQPLQPANGSDCVASSSR